MTLPDLKPMKILLMDERALDLLLLQDMLSASGYSNHKSFTDLSLSTAVTAIYEPDLIILAFEMSNKRNFELLERLKTQKRDDEYRPILVVLETDDLHLKRQALKYGATDFLIKPFNYTDALLRINNLLHTRQMYCAKAA